MTEPETQVQRAAAALEDAEAALNRAIREAYANGVSVSEIARQAGIHRGTVYGKLEGLSANRQHH